ncbi:hypothetical protein L1987_21151 [Smallanthus sonchifolius]|uniref:Uncharacterized protein n=1 Tax=Smallanthus sonchifolius TaxID=185202 RepID=A0ACB9IUA4_9ASTR|nr:hypothetical protein L1987_21151 [Smallanthus sonchifolius]
MYVYFVSLDLLCLSVSYHVSHNIVLANLLKEKQVKVVTHFCMDPEVQGVLTSAQKLWPHIHISDSLVMEDSDVTMAKAGCKFIDVLGVDFMSENVRAILDQAFYVILVTYISLLQVGVYRMSDEQIGCSLADAESSPAYMNYFFEAYVSSPSLHVVYINTYLETKAHAHELVPTITCTSSNVVQTILQGYKTPPSARLLSDHEPPTESETIAATHAARSS